MRFGRPRLVVTSLSVVLTACAQLEPGLPGADRPTVVVREDLAPSFIAFIGAKAQHAPPFLDTPGTNFYCLRSFLDRRTGETTHQLYVSDSYFGRERNWNAAHDGAGKQLAVVEIDRHEISCEANCAYLEEFAATIPAGELRATPSGLAVTFVSLSGDQKTIVVTGEQIFGQLAAIAARRAPTQPIAAFGGTPP
jgi:hypothetical protein